jgi:hypothetical protein
MDFMSRRQANCPFGCLPLFGMTTTEKETADADNAGQEF